MRFTLDSLSVGPYPDLWQVKHPPAQLFVEAASEKSLELFSRLPQRGFAIVGSRSCQNRSARLIRGILRSLAGFDLVVISGLARGVDAEAHAAALDEGIPTIGVLGCGLDISYPRENEALRKRIVDSGGLVVSEFPATQEPLPWSFLRRNRLIAGWSHATWVVEAGFRSGALNTAKWAREHGRHCYATPSFPGDVTMAGNQRILTAFENPAHPLWTVHSLGEAWLDIESFTEAKTRHEAKISAKQAILSEIRLRTGQRGGVIVAELVEWAVGRRIPVEILLDELQTAARDGTITRRDGAVISNA